MLYFYMRKINNESLFIWDQIIDTYPKGIFIGDQIVDTCPIRLISCVSLNWIRLTIFKTYPVKNNAKPQVLLLRIILYYVSKHLVIFNLWYTISILIITHALINAPCYHCILDLNNNWPFPFNADKNCAYSS